MDVSASSASVEAAIAAGQAGRANDELSSGRSGEAADQLLASVMDDLHKRGKLNDLVAKWGKDNFSSLDLDGNGKIGAEELKRVLNAPLLKQSLTPLERQMVRYMSHNLKTLASASNDEWGRESSITLKDFAAIKKCKPLLMPATVTQAKDFSESKPKAAAAGNGYLPDLMLEFGKENLKSLDLDGNGYVTQNEIRRVVNSPVLNRSLGSREQAILRNMDDMYEQIQRSHRDEWWYKDRKGITLADLTSYAEHQRHNRADIPTMPGDHNLKLIIGGVEREYSVHIPPGYDGKKPVPVVYFFHYLFGDSNKLNELTGMNSKSDKENFIVVYPKATGYFSDTLRQWNLNNQPSYKVNEIAFVGALMDNIESKLKVDRERTYVAGFSNGAMVAHEVAAKFSNRVAGLVAVSGCMTGKEPMPQSPVPTLIIHGTNDSLVPYTGRLLSPLLQPMKPVSFARDYWVRANGCDKVTTNAANPAVIEQTFTNSKTGTEVRVMTLDGFGHGWPGASCSIDNKICHAFRGVDVLWDFVSQQRKPR